MVSVAKICRACPYLGIFFAFAVLVVAWVLVRNSRHEYMSTQDTNREKFLKECKDKGKPRYYESGSWYCPRNYPYDGTWNMSSASQQKVGSKKAKDVTCSNWTCANALRKAVGGSGGPRWNAEPSRTDLASVWVCDVGSKPRDLKCCNDAGACTADYAGKITGRQCVNGGGKVEDGACVVTGGGSTTTATTAPADTWVCDMGTFAKDNLCCDPTFARCSAPFAGKITAAACAAKGGTSDGRACNASTFETPWVGNPAWGTTKTFDCGDAPLRGIRVFEKDSNTIKAVSLSCTGSPADPTANQDNPGTYGGFYDPKKGASSFWNNTTFVLASGHTYLNVAAGGDRLTGIGASGPLLDRGQTTGSDLYYGKAGSTLNSQTLKCPQGMKINKVILNQVEGDKANVPAIKLGCKTMA